MKKQIPRIIAFALFMQTLDGTIINTAIPTIAAHLNTDPINMKLGITSYLMSLAIFIPVSGWFADRFGTRNIFVSALLLFTLGSFFCGMATTLPLLVVSRIIQGIGGALMIPVARLILFKSFPKSELVNATNYATIPALLGPAIGPVIGGVIVTYVSWRWIFFVNIPFGLLGAFLAFKNLTNHVSMPEHKLDFIGFVLIGFGLAGISFTFEALSENAIPLMTDAIIFMTAVMLLVLYFFHARHNKYPFIDLKLFKIRTFWVTALGVLVSRCAIGGIPFVLPLFFQLSLGKSAMQSGLLISFYAAGMVCSKLCVMKILNLMGFKKLLIIITLLISVSLFLFAYITNELPLVVTISIIFIHGFLVSILFSCTNVLSFVDLTEKNISRGTSVATAIQQVSMSFGVAISALMLSSLLEGPINPFELNPDTFHETFQILGVISFLSTFAYTFLNKDDGGEASGYKLELAEAQAMKKATQV